MTTNTQTIRTLRAGGTVLRASGSGLACSVIRTLQAAGRLNVVRTGAATLYTLKETK